MTKELKIDGDTIISGVAKNVGLKSPESGLYLCGHSTPVGKLLSSAGTESTGVATKGWCCSKSIRSMNDYRTGTSLASGTITVDKGVYLIKAISHLGYESADNATTSQMWLEKTDSNGTTYELFGGKYEYVTSTYTASHSHDMDLIEVTEDNTQLTCRLAGCSGSTSTIKSYVSGWQVIRIK